MTDYDYWNDLNKIAIIFTLVSVISLIDLIFCRISYILSLLWEKFISKFIYKELKDTKIIKQNDILDNYDTLLKKYDDLQIIIQSYQKKILFNLILKMNKKKK